MYLYHGTDERAAYCIEQEGFVGGKAVNFSGDNLEGEWVFFADNLEHANAYGDHIFKVWFPDDVEMIRWEGYGPFGDDEIIIAAQLVNEEGCIEELIQSEMPDVI